LRDITGLVALGILTKDQGGGRSTSYLLVGGELTASPAAALIDATRRLHAALLDAARGLLTRINRLITIKTWIE